MALSERRRLSLEKFIALVSVLVLVLASASLYTLAFSPGPTGVTLLAGAAVLVATLTVWYRYRSR